MYYYCILSANAAAVQIPLLCSLAKCLNKCPNIQPTSEHSSLLKQYCKTFIVHHCPKMTLHLQHFWFDPIISCAAELRKIEFKAKKLGKCKLLCPFPQFPKCFFYRSPSLSTYLQIQSEPHRCESWSWTEIVDCILEDKSMYGDILFGVILGR